MEKLLLLVMLLTSTVVFAADGELRGLDGIALLIEELDDDAKECGITKKKLRLAAEPSLSQSPIRVFPRLQEGVSGGLIVTVNMLALPNDICVYNIDFEVWFEAIFKLNKQKAPGIAYVESVLGVAPRSVVERKVSGVVERLTKKFIVDRTADNPE